MTDMPEFKTKADIVGRMKTEFARHYGFLSADKIRPEMTYGGNFELGKALDWIHWI